MAIRRRDALKSILAGLATTPLFRDATAASLLASAGALRASAGSFLTPAQLETVAVLCELVLPHGDTPGARDAKVEQFVDRFLATAADEFRAAFRESLSRLDRRALEAHQRLFVRTSAAEQSALLSAFASGVPHDRDFFENLRSLAVYGYFTSPEGLAALGWKLDAGPYSGCTHDEHKREPGESERAPREATGGPSPEAAKTPRSE